MTTGKRSAHVEDLRPAQLKYLEIIGLCNYDPSISAKLNPKIIAAECRVPFGWRLESFHYNYLECRDVENFVFQAVADGASSVFSCTESTMCNEAAVRKIQAFIHTAKEAKKMLDAGAGRDEVGKRISAEGKVKFWKHWSGFQG